MSLRSRIKSFQQKQGSAHKIAGENVMFYPNRLSSLQSLRVLSADFSTIMSSLFSNDQADTASAFEEFESPNGEKVRKNKVEGITPELLGCRVNERRRAIEKLISMVTDRRSLLYLGMLFMDSMRDEFPYKKERSPEEVERFLFGSEPTEDSPEGEPALDTNTLFQIFLGWLKGNAHQFGEVGKRMMGLVKDRLNEPHGESTPETETETSGSDSKTQS